MKTRSSSSQTLLGLFSHAGVVVILLVSLFLGFLRWYLPYITRKGEEVTVPNVTYVPFDQAVKILEARKLQYTVIDSVWIPLQPPLAVVQHYPKAAARVKVNRRIQLWLNARIPPMVVFPELSYTSLAFARVQLERLELKPGSMLYRPDLAKGAVIECRHQGVVIQEGEKIRKGATIDVVVGTGVYAEPSDTGSTAGHPR